MTALGQSLAIWVLSDIFGGDPKQIVAEAKSFGSRILLPKFGNGTKPWQGLEPLIAEAKAQSLEVWGWWYFYGQDLEGEIAGKHARALGLDGVLIDWEGHADNSSLTAAGLRKKADRIGGDLRREIGDQVKLGLASWWKPSYHKPEALKILLGYCDLNAPQVYHIGRYDASAPGKILGECLDEYNRLFGWDPAKTFPGFASCGQNWGVPPRWWEATVPQLESASDQAKALGLPGIWWWSWNYLLGKSGNPDRTVELPLLNSIRSFAPDWSGGSPPPPPPGNTEELRAIADDLEAHSIALRRIAGEL